MLSANAEYPVKAEQLHDGTDLNTKITRYCNILEFSNSFKVIAFSFFLVLCVNFRYLILPLPSSYFCYLFCRPLSLSLFLSYSISPSLSISLSLALSHFTLLFSHPYFLLLRVEFEAACEDLFARLTAPIDAALKMAGKTLADVQSVELLGERSRKTVR